MLVFISIGAVSAEDNLTVDWDAVDYSGSIEPVAVTNSDIYVNPTGDDSSAGSQSNPYASIGKALNASNANSTIHLSEGVFTGDNNSGISLDKKNVNGTISIIGSGVDKTIIDLNGKQFLNIKKDTSILLKDLTIKNGYTTSNGGVINSYGILAIDNVKFLNNSAKSNGGALYISSSNSNVTSISNCQFINNTATRNGGAIVTYTTIKVQDCSFVNNKAQQGGSIYNSDQNTLINGSSFRSSSATTSGGAIRSSGAIVSNCVFEDCSATNQGGAIYAQNTYLYNNTIMLCSASNGPKIYGSVKNAKIVFSNADITSATFDLKAMVTDDKNNAITHAYVAFYLNETSLGSAYSGNDGIVSGTFSSLLDNGVYSITTKGDDFTVVNGTATVDINRNYVDLYVSPDGDDENNDGSKDKPFKTINKAITEGFSKNIFVNVHLLEGTYAGEGNLKISYTGLGYLNILGTAGKTVIDGENQNKVFTFTGINVKISNITFERLYDTSYNGLLKIDGTYQQPITVNVEDCVFKNSSARYYIYSQYSSGLIKNVLVKNNTINSDFIYGGFVVDNVTIVNNTGNQLFFIIHEIKNSKIINNTMTSGEGLIYFNGNGFSSNNLYVNNTCSVLTQSFTSVNDTFIGNGAASATGGAINANYNSQNVVIINGTFIDNVAKQGGAIYHRGGYLTFINCTFKGNHADEGNDLYGEPYRNPQLLVPNTLTFSNITSDKVRSNLSAVIDLGGISVGGYLVDFYVDGVYKGSAPFVNNTATFVIAGLKDGKYVINGSMPYIQNSTIVNGVLTLDAKSASVYDVYVSETGSDENGDGSLVKPFATIKHAFDVSVGQNALSTVIHIIGTIKGEGNVKLDLVPYVDLTIIGENKDTSIIDAENNNYIMDIIPYSDSVKLYIKNLTVKNGITGNYLGTGAGLRTSDMGLIRSTGMYCMVDNCIFMNNTGFALSADKKFSTFILNNSKFIESNGAFSSYQNVLDLKITNCEFINNYLSPSNNAYLIFIYDIYAPSSSSPYYNKTNVVLSNLTFNMTHVNNFNGKNYGIIYLSGNNNTIVDCKFLNSKDCSAIAQFGSYGSVNDIVNCYFFNNTYDFTSTHSALANPRPLFNIYNSTFVKSGAHYVTDLRYPTAVWTIVDCKFINMTRPITLGGSINTNGGAPADRIQNVSAPYVRVFNTLFMNSDLRVSDGNVSGCAFYNTTVSKVQISYAGTELWLDNNFWNANAPEVNNEYLPERLHLDSWLLPVLITNNASGPVQDIRLVYMSYNNNSGKYSPYDMGVVPVLPVNVTLSVSDGVVAPDRGVLTKDGLDAKYTYYGLGNQTVKASLDNGLDSSLNVTFYKTATVLDLDVNTSDLHVGDVLKVNVIVLDKDGKPVNGTVRVYVNSVLKDTLAVVNGSVVGGVVLTDVGPNELYVEFVEDPYYQSSDANKVFSVASAGNLVVDVVNEGSNDNVTFNIAMNYPANGTVTVKVDNKTYSVDMVDGRAVLSIPPLAAGDYSADVSYNGLVNTTASFNVQYVRDNTTTILSKDIELYYKNGTSFQVTLVDVDGNVLVNQTVFFEINGVNYTRVTNADGVASMSINLIPGDYVIKTYYAGNSTQDPAMAVNNVKVLSTISDGKDITLYFRNGTRYSVKVLDGHGNPAVNVTVRFNINGVEYKKITDNDGFASLAINLNPGTYIITAETPNGIKMSNNITVLPTISGENVVKYFRNGTQYHVKVFDGNGNPAAGQNVTFNINGVFYHKVTDENGIATLNINLSPGVYSITASFNGLNVNNKVEVLPIISANDLSKKFGERATFDATVVDAHGKPIAGQNVTFNVNGVFYHKVSDANGVAKLNINLPVGKYIITSEYNNCKTANHITVTK